MMLPRPYSLDEARAEFTGEGSSRTDLAAPRFRLIGAGSVHGKGLQPDQPLVAGRRPGSGCVAGRGGG